MLLPKLLVKEGRSQCFSHKTKYLEVTRFYILTCVCKVKGNAVSVFKPFLFPGLSYRNMLVLQPEKNDATCKMCIVFRVCFFYLAPLQNKAVVTS